MLDVQAHPLKCGRDDDSEQDEQGCRQPPERTPPATGERPVGEQQDGQRQPGDRDQFEEAVAGVLGIRQVRPGLDERAAAEQVAELHGDERQEQQVEERERDADLERPDDAAGARERHLLRPFSDGKEVAQQPARKPRPHGDDQYPLARARVDRRHCRREEALEDSIRGCEETAEEQQQGHAERDSAREGRHPLRPRAPAGLRPPDVGHQQRERADRRRPGGADEALAELGQRGGADIAQGPDADGRCDREQIRCDEQRRVVPHEERGEQHERCDHETPSLVQRDAPGAQEHGERDREHERPQRHVQSERLPLEEGVPENAEAKGCRCQRDPEPRPTTHGRLFNHARGYEQRL